MKKLFCAGALALAMLASLSNVPAIAANERAGLAADQNRMAATIDIARIKNVLRLSPDQERYWPAVEAALRNLARQQARSEEAGLMRRISRRVVSIVLDGAAIQRLAVAARPLIAALDAEQMQAASGLAREMGLGPVVAALK